MNWQDFILDGPNPRMDFTELSVYPRAGEPDEIFVGIGKMLDTLHAYDYGDCGYLRFGRYHDATGQRDGWAYVHQNGPDEFGRGTAYVADWRHGAIHATTMLAEDLGWHAFYPTLRALTPFAIHPKHRNIMAAVDYHMPMMSRDGSQSWYNLYCRSYRSGWAGEGLHLLCPRSTAMAYDGRLVIGAGDYGVFVGTDADNEAFRMLHADHAGDDVSSNFPDAIDVAVVRNTADPSYPGGVDEYYMVDEFAKTGHNPQYKSAVYMWQDGGATADWTRISEGLDAVIPAVADSVRPSFISQMALIDPYTIIVAAGRYVTSDLGSAHFYLCKGVRNHSTDVWTWSKKLDVKSAPADSNVQSRWVTDLRLIPGSTCGVFAAKAKGGDSGGVFVFDYGNEYSGQWASAQCWLYESLAPWDMHELAQHVSALEIDPEGQYLYVGTSRHDTVFATARGGCVLRCGLAGLTPDRRPTWEVLSGATESTAFLRDRRDGYPNCASQLPWWKWNSCITDIAIDPVDPSVCYVALNNKGYFDNETGVWRYANGQWSHLWGGGESGSGAQTVDISMNGLEIDVGSVGQEFFRCSRPALPAVPIVAANAAYPVKSYGAASGPNVLAVRVTAPAGTTVTSVVADGTPLAVSGNPNLVLSDNGAEPDMLAGDGIYTSPRLTTTIASLNPPAVAVTATCSNNLTRHAMVWVPVDTTTVVTAVADTAQYPILAGTTGLTTTLAVAMSSNVPMPAAVLPVNALGNSAAVFLRDNGLDGDDLAGDGIYTSSPFLAGSLGAGSYTRQVVSLPICGTSTLHEVSVTAVANKVRFADVTGSTGDLKDILTELPYSAVYFKSKPADPASEDIMIVTFDNDAATGQAKRPEILAMTDPAGDGAPQFATKTFYWIPGGQFPSGGRGVCYADYDNDGDNDFFLCNPSSGGRLYQNNLPAGFSDVTATVFGADVSYIANAFSASWGDYNRDGFVDLYVTGTNYLNSVQDLARDMCAASSSGSGGSNITYSGRLFRNLHGSGLRKTGVSNEDINNVLLCACWVDLDNDGDLDLVCGKWWENVIDVMENHGFDYPALDCPVLPSSQWMYPETDQDHYYGAGSVSVIDYDHNEYPDLLVTLMTYGDNPKAKILVNNYPASNLFTPIDVGVGTWWNGATVADFDLDGQEDFVLFPRTANAMPAMYMASGYSTAPSYEDRAYLAGLRSGLTGGGLVADFDAGMGGRHDPDLFLGRANGMAGRVLYHNSSDASLTNSWLSVNLVPNGNSNRTLIGTKLVVESAGGQKRWTKIVDGGSGRGSQNSRDLLFGLGDVTGNVTLRCTFPSGEDTVMQATVNQVITLSEHEVPAFKASTRADPQPTYSFALGPDTADWVFRWATANNKGDVKLDQVEILNIAGYPEFDYCDVGILPGQTRTLTFGDPDTSFLVYWDGACWRHEVRWKQMPCVNNCQYRYRVKSGVGNQSVTSPWRTLNTGTFCVVDPGDPQQ